MERSTDRWILLIALLAVLIPAGVAVRWMIRNPLPASWDEANYLNQAFRDVALFREGGPVRLAKSLMFEDPQRPPAYRVLPLPLTLVVGPSVPVLRITSLLFLLAALALLYAALRPESSEVAAIAVAFVAAAPAVFSSAMWFGTENALYVAIALTIFGALRRHWLALTIGLAIGFLAKVPFLLMAFPALAVLSIRLTSRERARLAVATTIAAVCAAPWWIYHWRSALAYSQYGRTFPREALQGEPLQVVAQKLWIFGGQVIGIPLLVLVVIAVIGWARRGRAPTRAVRAEGQGRRHELILLGLAGASPTLLVAFLSPVFVPRHLSPALFFLALPIAFFAAQPIPRLAAATLIAAQIVTIGFAFRDVMPADWEPLRQLTRRHAIDRPRIAFLGLSPHLSPPQIAFPWIRRNEKVDVRWLWRFEEGPIDWSGVMEQTRNSDVILIVDASTGPDNRHNRQFAAQINSMRELRPLPNLDVEGAGTLSVWVRTTIRQQPRIPE